jgi:glycosyltransferase involved in cell wall biosynthesis
MLHHFGISGRYVLAVSSHNPNKNFYCIVEAVRSLDKTSTQLVIAGAHDRNVYGKSLRLPDGVRVLGYINDSELKALYEKAACFVFAKY